MAITASKTFNPYDDGRFQSYIPSTNWSTTRDAVSATAILREAGPTTVPAVGKDSGGNFIVNRYFLIFNTSGTLPGVHTINSVKLRVYVTGTADNDNDGQDTIVVCPFSPTDPEGVVVADFDLFTYSVKSNAIDIGDISTSAYNEWTLTDNTLFDNTDYTQLGLLEYHDLSNAAYAGANSTYNYLQVYQGTSETNKPQLVVNYSYEPTGIVPGLI